jgi:hypothetical protein
MVGLLGTVLADTVTARREDRRVSRDALREAAADFAGNVGRARRPSVELHDSPADQSLRLGIDGAMIEARASYERIRLTADSYAAQEAARHVLHFSYWLSRSARDSSADFEDAQYELGRWLVTLYAEVRRELGLRHADRVFQDPRSGLPAPIDRSQDSTP